MVEYLSDSGIEDVLIKKVVLSRHECREYPANRVDVPFMSKEGLIEVIKGRNVTTQEFIENVKIFKRFNVTREDTSDSIVLRLRERRVEEDDSRNQELIEKIMEKHGDILLYSFVRAFTECLISTPLYMLREFVED